MRSSVDTACSGSSEEIKIGAGSDGNINCP